MVLVNQQCYNEKRKKEGGEDPRQAEWILCDDDSSDKYRQGMGQWAGVLGWRYLDDVFGYRIQK